MVTAGLHTQPMTDNMCLKLLVQDSHQGLSRVYLGRRTLLDQQSILNSSKEAVTQTQLPAWECGMLRGVV